MPKAAKPPAKAKAKPKAKPAKAAPKPAQRTVQKPAAKPKPKAAKPTVKVAAPKPAVRTVGKAPPKPAPPPAKAAGGVASRDTDGDADLSVAGQIYRGGKLGEGILHIDTRTGKIVRIAKSTTLDRHLDFGSAAILPGAIDVHVHFREPGHTHKEDLTSGSVSAAFGGVTGFVDMPNTLPATTTLRALKDKLALAAQKSVVDYAAWAGGSWYIGDLPEMLKLAAGVKTYLGATTGDLLLEDMQRFQQIIQSAGAAGRPVALHAESQRVLSQLRRTEASLQEHDVFRPPMAEVEAIYDAMKAVAATKKPPQVHIAHTASAEAVEAARTAKFSMGVCPHHLLLDTDTPLTHAYGKMNPPLRSPAARKQLWDLFAAGRIPILESDHAPHTGIEKEDSFHAAPSGVPGVETMVPLLLAQAKAGKVDLKAVVDAATRNPAQLLGLADRGTLESGLRADFAVYDMKPVKVEAKRLHAKCGWTPFEGHQAIFPTHTYLAGQPVVEKGQLVGRPGMGKPMIG